jgi:hypothetical protein
MNDIADVIGDFRTFWDSHKSAQSSKAGSVCLIANRDCLNNLPQATHCGAESKGQALPHSRSHIEFGRPAMSIVLNLDLQALDRDAEERLRLSMTRRGPLPDYRQNSNSEFQRSEWRRSVRVKLFPSSTSLRLEGSSS